MTQTSAAAVEVPTEPMRIQTRFGEMVVDPVSILRMPRGMLGFASLHQYALASLPEERFGRFKLLQSLDTPELSFVVLPYEVSDNLLAQADIDDAYKTAGIAAGAGALLLVVSIRKSGEQVIVSVNLRAPVVVDVKNRAAWQFVLNKSEYSVRHTL